MLEQLTLQLTKRSKNAEIKGYEEILDALPIGVSIFNSRICMWINHFGYRLFGFKSRQEIIGKNSLELYTDRTEYERVGKCIYPEGITVAKVKKNNSSEKHVVVRVIHSQPETGEAMVIFYSMEDMIYLCKSICICDSIRELVFDQPENGKCV